MKQRQGRCWTIVAAMAAVATLALGPIDASAVTLSYTQQGGFTIGTATSTAGTGGVEFFAPTGFTPTSGPNTGQATYGEIGWGCGSASASLGACSLPSAPNNTVAPQSPVTGLPAPPAADFPVNYRSALDGDPFSGVVEVGGDWVNIFSLQHYNRTIGQDAASLTQIQIDTLLTLDSIPPTGGDSDAGSATINFQETLNAGPCQAGTGDVPCPDIFTFAAAEFDPVVVTIDGVQYLLEFQLIFPGTTFDERTGQFVGNGATFCPNGAICTAENAISEAIIQMRVVALAVPAPAALLLLGFGLSGLGVVGWLRRS